jgi:GNAT superfamily N-acetyltransferase
LAKPRQRPASTAERIQELDDRPIAPRRDAPEDLRFVNAERDHRTGSDGRTETKLLLETKTNFRPTSPRWWIIWAKYLRPETSLTLAYEMVHIHHISVGSEYRRQGVGRALLGAARACGLELGIELLTLDVWSFNEDARAFFQRNGFNPYIERLWCR